MQGADELQPPWVLRVLSLGTRSPITWGRHGFPAHEASSLRTGLRAGVPAHPALQPHLGL